MTDFEKLTLLDMLDDVVRANMRGLYQWSTDRDREESYWEAPKRVRDKLIELTKEPTDE